ncbi:MAG TPA: choice-of-anchor D domain-containing protein [Candidatus Kapabacteria bacterium]
MNNHLSSFSSRFSKFIPSRNNIRGGSIFAVALLVAVGWYSIDQTAAHENGITGCTQKSNNSGCYCHCDTSATHNTTVTLTCSSGSSPLTASPSTTYNFTIRVANSGESDGGCDIATYSGNGLTAGSDGLQLEGGELTHESPKSFGGNGYCTWNFTYTSSSSSGFDTIYANGNAVNGDGFDNCSDQWNWSPKFIIHTVTQPVRMALSRSSVSLGSVRVGARKSDSLKVTSTGTATITISSSAMKTGTLFSSFPTSSNRSLTPGTSEIDSVIFTPTSSGSFSDSLIFNTNSDTVAQQRMAVAVSGQGVQAIFNPTNGTNIAFGNLHVGRTAQKTYSFSNSGNDTLFLQTPSISGTGYTIATNVSTLTYPPNATGNVVVQFAPTATQSYNGSLTFTASNGVSAPTVPIGGTGTLPQIQIASSANLGSIRVGQTLQGSVSFKNVGSDTLHLSNASVTQASTKFTLGSYDQTVLPNATGTVHIAYLPTAEQTDTGTLHFTSDDPANTTVAVAISAAGLLPHMVVTESGDTINFGSLKINSSSQINISVRNSGGADLNLSNVTAGPSPFSLISSPNVVSAGTTGTITASFSPTSTNIFTGTVIVHSDDAANASDTVYLVGTGINSALTITPASINFDSLPVMATVQDTITLSDSGKANVNIYSVQISPLPGPFAIVGATPSQVIEGGSATIVVSFTPTTAGNYSGAVTLLTDDNSAPTRTVNLIGTAVSDPFIVAPSSVDFGEVPLLTKMNDTIVMKNTGATAVAIHRYALTNGLPFSIADSTAHSVGANDSAIVVVSFDPTLASSYSSTLTISTNDVSSPQHTVLLSGIGVKGTLTINPASLDFGTVLLGHDSVRNAELRNVGQAAITINGVSIVGTNTSAFNNGSFVTPTTITASDSLPLTVTFTPATAQSYADTVRFTLADGTSIDVPLTGAGANGAGVAMGNQSQFHLFITPNPATNAIVASATVSVSSSYNIEVFDALGRTFVTKSLGILDVGTHEVPLSLEGFADGTYFIRLTDSEGHATQIEFIVEKQ